MGRFGLLNIKKGINLSNEIWNLFLRGCPHAHICAFLHPDDKLKQNADRIDQMIWTEIPLDYGSDEFKEYVKEYRREDDHRTHVWKDKLKSEEVESEGQKDKDEKKSHKVTYVGP